MDHLQDLSEKDSIVSYIPYTKKVSSTLLKEVLIKLNK